MREAKWLSKQSVGALRYCSRATFQRKGYFDIMHDVDRFVFYDDVQFTPRDWRTRNRVKTANGSMWLTVPAGQSRSRLIHEVMLEDKTWGKKLKALRR